MRRFFSAHRVKEQRQEQPDRRAIPRMPLTMNAISYRSTNLVFLLLAVLHVARGFSALPRTPQFRSHAISAHDYGDGMDQEAMMESDMLIIVDENDVVVEDVVVSKKKAHAFSPDQPRGIAHRAFSFFIFNDKNEMLLTRRADSKITFPGVWTNTACSHPLHGMTPNEVDQVPDAYPNFPGIKHAAIRKLKHELGIEAKYVPHGDIQFVSRFHYWAADTKTYGENAPWGEHEVDYVLFLHCQTQQPVVVPNPDEVDEFKYVSVDGLKTMFEDPSLKWSPWFRGIMDDGGFRWWEDLENTMAGKNTHPEVHFFDPPSDHYASYNDPSHTRHTGVIASSKSAEVGS